MSINLSQAFQNDNESKAKVLSGIIMLLLFLIIIIPLIPYTFPPPEKQGVLITFGDPDVGSGDLADVSGAEQNELDNPNSASPETPSEANKGNDGNISEKGISDKQHFLTSTDDNSASLSKESASSGLTNAEQKERDRLQKAAEEAQRIADEEARKKAEFEASKNQFGNLLKGSGKGDTDKAGKAGDHLGDPDSDKLEGIKIGSGNVGGGLADRGVLYEPEIRDNSQKSGRVVVKVCVNENGKVISANYTQKGSTTNDGDLKRIAEQAAMQYRFTVGSLEKQCGTITVNFVLK